ncbi:substrate-binding domain-containing protein [Cryptosporangium aurantiacum]|uniref:Fructose transport system substrate-binding protein n=1 Tax=Cryptosporangium aurantiacum TaxID=134849 RepID=A0A1M7RG71_9ACTN|nr:substrate-binding domain-containing protein [Cryptosporangium aurantiacum]SHN45152.1 fructose transport system substrate-binding protein [Cryptosporangium aurantiacum]
MKQRTTRRALGVVTAVALALAAAGCGGDSGGDGDTVAVSLITKNSTNPFFVTMQEGAKKAAKADGVELTLAAGKEDGDEQTQVQAIEDAIARGDNGILITPNGPGVNTAIKKARDAGLYVIALDTPPDPANTVDITFATDNFRAGELIGKWTGTQLGGKPATIAMLDLFNDKIVSVDYNRDQGFLTGMGIPTGDAKKNGDEAKSGRYSGGTYQIACNEPTQGAEDGGRTAMERCLAKNPKINVVYTINEPAAVGAQKALQAAGVKDVLVVSIDGGCDGVQQVKDGIISATSQQYPVKMAELGVKAIKEIATGGDKPAVTDGKDFFDTGVALVTDKPADGVESIDTTEGAANCWGKS